MTTAKELLEAATPLPWDEAILRAVLRRGLHGFDDDTENRHAETAALIVYAVNRLPDYEAAVEALERMVATVEMFTDLNINDDALVAAHAALARLRSEVPA